MKRYLGLLTIVAIAGLCVWGFIDGLQPADARIGDITVDKIITPPEGYSTIVCSSWLNPEDLFTDQSNDYGTTTYQTIDPPAGCYFELIQFYAVKAGAAQYCSLRAWGSSTDSTVLQYNGSDLAATPVNWLSGASALIAEFPVRATKFSVKAVSSEDDVIIVCYARNY